MERGKILRQIDKQYNPQTQGHPVHESMEGGICLPTHVFRVQLLTVARARAGEHTDRSRHTLFADARRGR